MLRTCCKFPSLLVFIMSCDISTIGEIKKKAKRIASSWLEKWPKLRVTTRARQRGGAVAAAAVAAAKGSPNPLRPLSRARNVRPWRVAFGLLS